MQFYRTHVLPRLTHLAMRQEQLRPYRKRVVSATHGRVLELGIGSGLNLPLYPDSVERVVGIDPSPGLLRFAAEAARRSAPETELIEGTAEKVPLENRSMDCAVVSWTLCSVMDPDRALSEIRRVLKSDGILSFVEHGLSPDKRIRRWQHWLTPVWCRCAGNCHLNRPTASLVERSGFRLERLETGYARGPKPMAFMYEGLARAA
jgi:ubiquinone/menaquinone biosynthesis C-methylase UbiE